MDKTLDRKIPTNTSIKRLMINNVTYIESKEIYHFICCDTKQFLTKSSLPIKFLEHDPTTWS